MKIKIKIPATRLKPFSAKKTIQLILSNREITDVESFLNPPNPQNISLQQLGYKKQIKVLIQKLKTIKEHNEMIVVYTDYDADGITGGAILWETLYLLGFNTMPYVPHRKKEGYGFSKIGIDTVIKKYNPKLIISVDHGISAAKEISYAKKKGIAVIVTDHHIKPKTEPKDAESVIHIPALSGSGVAYFVAKEIHSHFSSLTANYKLLTTYFHSDYLALATIGTIADLVPLTGVSRSIVFHGLKTFSSVKRPGLKHILEEAKIATRPISPYEIGYIIAPRINAVGRLGSAIDALRTLCTNNNQKAKELAEKMGATNRTRQNLVESTLAQAIEMVESVLKKDGSLPFFVILKQHDWHEGIIGLIAGKITEKYYRPTLVLTKSEGFWKGSARSISALHITDFLRSFEKDIISVGGHKQAAGLSVSNEKIQHLIKDIEKEIKQVLKDADLEKTLHVDIEIPLNFVNLKFATELERLEPFGMGNPQPLFSSAVKILMISPLGKKKEHLKLIVKDPKADMFPLECIYFSAPIHAQRIKRNDLVQLIYSLDVNRWNGREKVQLKALHLNRLDL